MAGTYVGAAGLYIPPYIPGVGVSGKIHCDFELLDGGGPRSEPTADGASTPAGMTPDGTWDDGGMGGACHTILYGNSNYNTPGCIADVARAVDDVLGGSVWIGAGCDWLTDLGGGVTVCGADDFMDEMAYGTGSPGVTYPTAGFLTSGCATGEATMAVFVWDSINGKATRGTIWAD